MLACSECKTADMVLLREVVYQMVIECWLLGRRGSDYTLQRYHSGLGLTLVIVSLLLNPSLLTDCT